MGGVGGSAGMDDDGSETGVDAAAWRSWRTLSVRRYMRLVPSMRRWMRAKESRAS